MGENGKLRDNGLMVEDVDTHVRLTMGKEINDWSKELKIYGKSLFVLGDIYPCGFGSNPSN